MLWTNLVLAAVAALLIWLLGIAAFLLVWAPAALLAGGVGIWLFYVQLGYHHIHHLSVRIPNYNLQRAHRENPFFHSVPTLSLGWARAVRLKLWDEQAERLVTFKQARALLTSRAGG